MRIWKVEKTNLKNQLHNFIVDVLDFFQVFEKQLRLLKTKCLLNFYMKTQTDTRNEILYV